MRAFEVASVLITLAAVFSYVNHRLLGLPTTIGVMLLSLGSSLVLILIGHLAPGFHAGAARVVAGVDFQGTVLHVMLAFLLFAGAMQLNLADLKREWGFIASLAFVGTVASAFLVAGACWAIFQFIGVALPWAYCLLFGALISPTDPIAVLAIMKNVNAPASLETQIAAESLFNDGVGVVLFLAVLEWVSAGRLPSWGGLGVLFLRQVVGGAALGMGCGYMVYRLLKQVDNYQVEALLTLALAMGTFTLAEALGFSAPIAVVVAGLLVGNPGRSHAMSQTTRDHVDTLWELIDEVLNATLFLLVGLEVLVMHFVAPYLAAGVIGIAVTLAARWVSVSGVARTFGLWRDLRRGTVAILTWGGLRGGLSVAMALALPHGDHRDFILAVTYAVVVFSVFAQGLTIGAVVRNVSGAPGPTS